MKSASSTYKMVRAVGTGWYEWRVNQGENIYELDRLKSVDVSFALAGRSGIGIGNANSSECKITLLEESVNWPRMADFTVQFRICTNDSATKSEWITLGKYYTDERSEDKFGNLSIVAFDAMLMMEQSWTDKIPEQLLPASWPITSKAWASMIQAAGLATFADLTQLDDTLAFVGLDTTTSIRDVLKTIATVHAGNWVMTVGETLNLIQFENVTQEQTEKYSNLQQKVQAIEDSPALEPVTGIHLETSEGTIMESGDDDGYVVKSICDVADTDGIAAFCLSKIEDYVFKPFRANVAYLDPIVEIGDSVSIDNVIYQIMSLDWNVQKNPTANVSAPYDQEIDHEYQVVSQDAKNYRKTISAVNNKLEDYLPWNEVSTAIEQNAESVVIAASGTYVTQTTFNNEIAEIQAQIDGNIQSWSGNVVPTLNNAPAVNWTTPIDKAAHVGDMYFINSDAGIPEAGNYYRFEENNGVYSWQLITDSALTEALAKAAAALAAAEDAQDTADAASAEAQLKGRIFVVQPTPPYSVGDLWFNSAQSEILTCMTARESGNYVASDWVKRNKYTDDSAFNAFQETYSQTIAAIQDQVDKKAETYYQATDPVSSWVSAAIAGIAIAGLNVVGVESSVAQAHKGDLWYRTTDNTTWYWDGEKWVQQDVPDEVFDKIDGKAQIFIVQPYTPYNVGDLWFDSANSDIMTCITARASGSFVQGDWQKRNKYTDDSALASFVSATYNPTIAAIQADLDGKIDTYFYSYEPTLSNVPASQWNTVALKENHLDDLFYNTATGYTYRFTKSGSTYSWVRVKDSDITSAMQAASNAQDTADGKRRVFVSQPTDSQEYDVGDLWVNATYGSTYTNDILKCKTAKAPGTEFSISHWEKASKYTDDSSFNAFVNSVYTPEISAIQSELDGKVDTYFYAYAPTLLNLPASQWNTDDLREAHVDDLFFDTVSGYTYRFKKSGSSTYSWERVKDSDITAAMTAASTAQDTADGKRRVFVSQPTNAQAYDVGDLWVNATYGSTYSNDLLRCKTAKAAGTAFNISHWEKASKYTDDTAANNVAQQLTTFESSFSVEPSQINAEITKRVIKDHSETKTTFGWEMTDTYHKWYADNSEVVRINSGGVFVKGEIRATTGYIGNDSYGFEINATNFHNGMTSLSDTTHNGVYVGTDGIALGQGKFKVTSSGAVTASNLAITGGSIKLGGTDSAPVFSVTSSGAVTASNLTITGGSISINNGAFRVDSNGNLTANNGTFGGNVYAKNIQYGGDAGTYNGAGVTPGTIYGGGASGQIAQNTLGDYNVAKVGSAGAYTPASFSSGVQGSLYNADMFGYATRRGSAQYPEYFCATSITALSTMYANDFYIELGGDTQLGLKTHYHTVVVSQDGTVQFGQPTNTRPDPFNIADTHFFEDYVSAIDVSSLTRTYPDGESSYPYYDSATLGKIIEFKVQYQISDGDGTVLTGGSQLMTVPAGAAYDAGHNDGERGVSVTAIQYYTVSGEETVTYNSTNKTLNASVQATLTNGNTNGSIRTVTIPATLAYNAGHGDGADTVTVTTITRTYPDGESSYPYYDSATLGKVIEFKAIATMSNGHSGTQVLTVPATAAYNAGYEAGSQGGSGSVTVESVGRDTSQSTTYDSSTKLYTIPILATASNGATKTGTVQQSGAAAYLAGQTDAEAGITVSVTAEQSEWVSSTHKKVITVTTDVKNSSETTIKTNTSLIQVDATEVFNSVSATVSMSGTQSASQANRGFIAAASTLTNGRTFTGAYYFYLNETENTSTAVTMQVTDSNSNVLATKTITPQGSDVHVTAMQYYTVSGEQTISYDSANKTLSASVQATLSNGNTNGSIRTVTFPADLAYDAGSTDGAAAVAVSTIGFNQEWAESATGYKYNASSSGAGNYSMRIRATLNEAGRNRRYSITLTLPADDAYNAGASSVTASAAGLTTDSSSYGTYDQAIGLGSSSVYTVSGTTYGRIKVTLSNGVERVIRVGVPDTSGSVAISAATGITTSSSNYTTYDRAIGLGASSVYASGSTQYGRVRVNLSNGKSEVIRVSMPYNTPATVSSIGDNGTYWNSTYSMYLVQAAATMSDGTIGGTGSWYLNPTEAINFGKSQASGYTNVYSGADLVAWYQSGGDVTGVKVRVYVYGTPAGGSSAQLIRYDDVTFNRY